MRSDKYAGRRKLSAGTVFMLVLLVVVLAGSALVLGRLSSGAKVDLSKLNMNVLDLSEEQPQVSAANPEQESAAVADALDRAVDAGSGIK